MHNRYLGAMMEAVMLCKTGLGIRNSRTGQLLEHNLVDLAAVAVQSFLYS